MAVRALGGRRAFLVRVEDLDAGRVRPGLAAQQLADLAAIGLDWDGRSSCSRRAPALYEEALARLPVYECFCTRAEIRESASAAHGPVGRVPGDVPGADRRPSGRRGAPQGACPALRVRAGGAVVGVRGPRARAVQTGVVDDFVVRRNDGAFAYNLAVVVDDAAQGIEEVVRGADLLDSTPRQIWLARALGCPGRRTRTCRWCSAPTGGGWRSATAT